MAKKRKLTKLWLTRTKNYYHINMGAKPKPSLAEGYWAPRINTKHWSVRELHRTFPKSLHLPPGGGPVEFEAVKKGT